jgi:hypothetical protein
MDGIETVEMGDVTSGMGWTDVYRDGEFIGHFYVQNIPTTRYMARDAEGEYIREGDFPTRDAALDAIVGN